MCVFIAIHAKAIPVESSTTFPDIIFPESADLVNFGDQEAIKAAIFLSGSLFSEAPTSGK